MASSFSARTITWYDESDGYVTNADITSKVLSQPLFTDTGSGEVNELELELSAKAGNFLTSGNRFDKYDRIRIEMTDINGNTYDRFFEIDDIIPSMVKSEGVKVTLVAIGTEYHTQAIHHARRDWFENAYDVADNIGETYLANRGSRQPVLQRHDTAYSFANAYGNALPDFTNNHYEFGESEDACYNRWMDIIDLLGGGVGSGGVGEFYELYFDTPSVNAIDISIPVSGARTFNGRDPANDGFAVTITNTDSINVSEQEAGISNPTGTKVAIWGSKTHGSLPIGTSKYRAHELEFVFRPQWASGVEYKQDAKVLFTDGKHYRATADHTSSGSNEPTDGGAPWALIDFSSEFGDTIQYSEWTDDKAALWANAGANPDGVTSIPAWAGSTAYTIGDLVSNGGSDYVVIQRHTSSGTFANDLSDGKLELVDHALKGNGAAFFDSNIVIRDDGVMFRTWVHEVIGDTDYDTVNDAAPASEYSHTLSFHNPIGHRILNVSDTQLSGNDLRGRSFEDAVVQWSKSKGRGEAGQWEVIYEQPTSTLNKMQVFDIKDRKVWEWDNTLQRWQDVTTSSEQSLTWRNDDCAHEWKAIYNIQGSDPRPTQQSTTPFNEDANDFATNVRSAVEVCYEFDSVIHDFFTSTADTKKGAWLNFGFPFPVSTYNTIGEGVGDIYGGGTNEQASLVTQPSVLDIQNMTWTSDGRIGFNHATSEELGPISSLAFNMRISINDVLGNPLGGATTVRCTMYDTHDNVVIQDFDIDFTDGKNWQPINLPIGGFSNHRGRVPKNWSLRWSSTIFGIEIPLNELDVQDVFRFNEIKYITFQIQDFYDKDGRFDPQNDIMDVSNTGAFTAAGGTIRMAIDAFHFKKALLAITGTQSVQNVEPVFLQRPNIISYTQLANEANSELEVHQHREKVFNITTSGHAMFDIRAGDTFFLENDRLVDDADRNESAIGAGDGDPNTIRLVAKRIEYHLTQPSAGPGGFTRSIKGVKRFT